MIDMCDCGENRRKPMRHYQQPSQRRKSHEPTPSTLSLPIIPSASRPNESLPQRSRRTSPNARAISRVDKDYDDYGYDDDDNSYDRISHPSRAVQVVKDDPMIPTTDEMVAISRKLAVARTTNVNRAIASYYGPSSLPKPVRPMKRIMVWQVLLLIAIIATFVTSLRATNTQNGSLNSPFNASAQIQSNTKIVDKVPTFIQLDPTIGYKSYEQYQLYSGADCGAAATSEILTAWGDPKGLIGQVIEDMGSSLSPKGGVSYEAFPKVASKHNFNLSMRQNLTADQLRRVINDLGIPVQVGVRETSGGYYRNFAPGHHLVVTGSDANGFKIVDSSTYFIHYLPNETFFHLWKGWTFIYYPKTYNLPEEFR
jgi:predicted double-glycine peptidase